MSKLRDAVLSTYAWVVALPTLILLVGVLSNQVVLIANHDKFPVLVNNKKLSVMLKNEELAGEDQHKTVAHYIKLAGIVQIPISVVPVQSALKADPDGMIDYTHCVMSKSNWLKGLADVWDFGTAIYSVGDGLIYLGVWLLTFAPIVWLTLAVKKLWDYCEAW